MRTMTQWLLVPCLLPLIGCGGGGGGGIDADLKFLPANCSAVGSARVSDILASQAYKDVVAETKKMGAKEDPAAEFKDQMGIPLGDVATVTFGFTASSSDDHTLVVKTSKPITAAELMKNLKPRITFAKVGAAIGVDGKLTPPPPPQPEARKFKEVKVGSYTMHEEEAEFGQLAFCVVNPTTVVFAEPKPLKAILERDKKAELPEGLKKALAKANTSRTVFVAVDGQRAVKQLPPSRPGEENPLAGVQATAADLEGAVIEAVIGSDAQITTQLLCKSSETAGKLQKDLEGLIALGRLFLTQVPPGAPKEAQQMANETKQMLDGIKFSASGSSLNISATIKPSALLMVVGGMGRRAETTFEKVGESIQVTPPPPKK